MTTITENTTDDYVSYKNIVANISTFFKAQGIGQILRKANAYKSKGIPAVQVLIQLVTLIFTGKSMYMNKLNGTNDPGYGRDVVYRLLNSTHINWSTYLSNLAASVIVFLCGLTGDDRKNALIVDDSLFERPRSKKVELLARVHDHAEKSKNKFKRGFRMLTLGWSDGVSFIPLLFRLMSSQDKKNRYNEQNPNIDKRSAGYKARTEATSCTTDVLISMLTQAKKLMIPAQYVLFDSWFSFPSTIMRIKKVGFDVVSRLKDIKTIKYLVNGTKRTLKQIYAANKKRRGRAKYLLSVEVMLYSDVGESIPARIVFVRDRNNRKKWIAFISTDMSLTEDQIIALYGKRWDIEVFFKICKSYLKLAGEFQGLSYDFMTAHTAIVMTRYIILATEKRRNEDQRSFGEVFHLCCDELADIQFADVLTRVLNILRETLSGDECLFLSSEQISIIIGQFVANLRSEFKRFFTLSPAA